VETLQRQMLHHVLVVHGGTGRRFDRITARLVDPVWPYWRLRRRGADLVLSTETRWEPKLPATTSVEVAVADDSLLERFQNSGTAQVVLNRGTDADLTLTLVPEPVVLEVVLTKQDGTPRPGRTVEARGNGDVVALTAAAGSNVYRSPARAWDPAQQPYGVFVAGQKQASVSLDYTRPVTRVKVIDG
jgi:hypothetical protein